MSNITVGLIINNKYRLSGRIAHGGMAEIFEAVDVNKRNQYTAKFLLENLLNDENNLRRFDNEINICKKLNHPNIVKVYEKGIYQNRPFIIFEYINGQTLGNKLDLNYKFNCIECCEIIAQLCDALIYLHDNGIIHRDIKPDNIFYCHDGIIKLSDFGVAVDLTNIKIEDMYLVGSPNYLPPELFAGKEASRISDLYSLGVTFYELITSRLPYIGKTPEEVAMNQTKQEIIPPSEIEEDLPLSIEKIILKAINKDPLERYQTAREFKEDILNVLKNKNKYMKKKSFFQKLFGFRGK